MGKKRKQFLIYLIFFAFTFPVSAQIPNPPKEDPAFPLHSSTPLNRPNSQIRRINPTPVVPHLASPTSNNYEEKYQHELQQRNAALNEMLYEYSIKPQPVQYDLPAPEEKNGTEYYRKAFNKLCGMLNGSLPLSLKEAVFTLENAYFEGQLNYSEYLNKINRLTEIAQQNASRDGYDWNNPVTRNIMLFRVMADTLYIKIPQKETPTISYPMMYDFEDFYGRHDWSKMFVTKLLATHKGQCHSLPLLYLILCEETKAEAHLAYSPSHSYIKFQDDTGKWHNLELTNGHVVSDAYIAGSGFVTSEAIKNKIYMEPQTQKQVIAQCLCDLALGYERKYGYDNFIKQCTDSVLKYDINNLSGLMIKSNYETKRFDYVVNQVGRPHPDILKEHYPEIYQIWQDRDALYDRIDASGYREMPQKIYEDWLHGIEKEKERSKQHMEKTVLPLIK